MSARERTTGKKERNNWRAYTHSECSETGWNVRKIIYHLLLFASHPLGRWHFGFCVVLFFRHKIVQLKCAISFFFLRFAIFILSFWFRFKRRWMNFANLKRLIFSLVLDEAYTEEDQLKQWNSLVLLSFWFPENASRNTRTKTAMWKH